MKKEISQAVMAKRQQQKEWALILKDSTSEVERNKAASGIYKAFYKPLLSWFNKNVGNSSDVRDMSDLAILTLEKTLGRIHQYNAMDAELSTWVFKIGFNVMLDHKRRSKGIDVISVDAINYNNSVSYGDSDSENFELPSHDRTPDVLAGASQAIVLLRAEVENLREVERQAIKLRFFEERTYEEISDEMKVSVDRVKTLLFRGKAKLRKVLPEGLMITA